MGEVRNFAVLRGDLTEDEIKLAAEVFTEEDLNHVGLSKADFELER